MVEKSNNQLVPPGKKTVNVLCGGIAFFYLERISGSRAIKSKLDPWPKAKYKEPEFAELLQNITGGKKLDEAIEIVLGWKETLEKGGAPEKTIPEDLDGMISSLDEKLNAYEQQKMAKDSLYTSQKMTEAAPSEPTPTAEIKGLSKPTPADKTEEPSDQPQRTEAVPPKPDPTVETKKALDQPTLKTPGPLSIVAGRILTVPIKTAVYFAGPTDHSKSAGVATARHYFAKGIDDKFVRSLKTKAPQLNVTQSQLNKLAGLIKTEQEAHPFAYKWLAIASSRLPQVQRFDLLYPSPDRTTAVLPRKLFLGNSFGRVGQQVFGPFFSKTLKVVGKKVLEKIATTIAVRGATTALAPPVSIALFISGKIKDFISSLKSKSGRKNLLALMSGAMIIGGVSVGGLAGSVFAAGGFILGAGAIATAAGGFRALGANAGGLVETFIAGITGVFLPAIIVPAIIASFSVPLFIALTLFIINSGAYIVPPQAGLVPGLIESPYIGINKTANPPGPFGNGDLPITIEYTVEVIAKKGTLTNIEFEDTCEVIKENSAPNCPSANIPEAPQIISPVEPFSFSYSIEYGPGFTDSFVIDTFTVTANAPEQAGAQSATSASIKIGSPPEDCPNDWPVFGVMTQGAYSSSTHKNAEAIDIGVSVGNTVTARHSGIVRSFGNIGPYGKHVEVVSTCNGKEFFSRYAHLSVVSVQTGQKIRLGQSVGLSGDTGNSTGPHLHYEFRDPDGPKKYPSNSPYMMKPFVPKNLPRGCVRAVNCKTSIP